MKKSKIKKLIKKARKSAKNELEGTLITLIKDAVTPLGILSKKTTKDINKAAKALAGKLAEKLPFEMVETPEETVTEQKSETVATDEVKKTASKPVRRRTASPVKRSQSSPAVSQPENVESSVALTEAGETV